MVLLASRWLTENARTERLIALCVVSVQVSIFAGQTACLATGGKRQWDDVWISGRLLNIGLFPFYIFDNSEIKPAVVVGQ